MAYVHFIWDEEDDHEGNVAHFAEHGVTMEEAEEVLLDRKSETEISRSSGNYITFGWTSAGRHLAIVWQHVMDDPRTIRPVTGYETEPRRRRRRKR